MLGDVARPGGVVETRRGAVLVRAARAVSHVVSWKQTERGGSCYSINLCRTTLARFLAGENLRGNLPFSRVREEELSDSPTRTQPTSRRCARPSRPPRSSRTLESARLDREPAPSAWVVSNQLFADTADARGGEGGWNLEGPAGSRIALATGRIAALDACALAECLKEVGRELGVLRGFVTFISFVS
ncbi:hypothetical protein FA95DRAFT_1683667 [Auriscalpium vulgare]|uniref:Uncharacterized protein n=1 Tax=Auriscalpium vulgare TaxID=40419 RepID=A0ACB8R9I6_9AGAM|nr:hypothetical protein FA95DRAFT_1683667 [Auriscalpium vulgare]